MEEYSLQKTTIWSFPDRGSWATHKGDYRGNWSPHVPKNLILNYTKENQIILDPFVGSGTTLIECKILNRNGIGVDINPNAVDITLNRLNFDADNTSYQKVYLGDAKKLNFIENESIDFICTHPPYANIISYSENLPEDLSNLGVEDFINSIKEVSKECYRVLKSNGYCAIMIGDIRKKGNVIPLGFKLMSCFIDTGFTLKEIIIKEQHNCRSTKYWKNKNTNFYLLAHEYIFVFFK